MNSLIDITDLSVEELDELMDVAEDISRNPDKYSESCKRKKLAALFFEPSTRTRFSFEAAMLELGGSVLQVFGQGASSTAKGESLADTARTVSCYADIIAIRHPKSGSALAAAMGATIPVINAGDGDHCHPTQTLADLMTIRSEKGRLDHLKIGFCGDLKYGRTVHSLIAATARYPGNEYVLISPEELCLPDYVKTDIIAPAGQTYREARDLETAVKDLDILYMTRIQRERFPDPAVYERLKNSYILTPEILAGAPEGCRVLHPLPRVNEISVRVDADPRACYFKQVLNGKYMRMALILNMLARKDRKQNRPCMDAGHPVCRNPRCVAQSEQEIPQLVTLPDAAGNVRCLYCDSLLTSGL